MNIGAVIEKKDGLHVVTVITNGQVEETELLEKFISRNVCVESDGEFKTLKEIIEIHCDTYLSNCEIIKEYLDEP